MSPRMCGRAAALAAALLVTAACASSHKAATAGEAVLATGSSAASALTSPASAHAEPVSPTPTSPPALTPTASATSTPPAATPGVTTPAAASVPAGTGVIVSEKDNGHVVGVRLGETVELELHSLYWKVAPATGGVLTEKGTATKPPAPGQAMPGVPGSGAGTIDVTYVATAAGSATISAHRDTCGEALRCGPDQSDFTVTITVS